MCVCVFTALDDSSALFDCSLEARVLVLESKNSTSTSQQASRSVQSLEQVRITLLDALGQLSRSAVIALLLSSPGFVPLLASLTNLPVLGVQTFIDVDENKLGVDVEDTAEAEVAGLYTRFFLLPSSEPLRPCIPGTGRTGVYIGITIRKPKIRLSEHRSASKKGTSLHHRATDAAEDEKSIVALPIPDQAATAERMRKIWPRLAHLGDRHLVQCLHVGAEAMITGALGSYKGNAAHSNALSQGVQHSPIDFVGLNSTTCLATGIVGLAGFGTSPSHQLKVRADATAE